MVFTSAIFLYVFLPVVLGVYYLLHPVSRVARNLWLTGATLFFYGWARVDFAALLVISIVTDYWCGKIISRSEGRRRKIALLVSIGVNLSLLLYFKYFNLAMDTTNAVRHAFGGRAIEFARVMLPAGISFYTFETMSYSIDIYRGTAKPARNLLEMSGFVAFFPRLVAGPIVRYHDIEPQLGVREHSLARFFQGVLFFQAGFAKKMLIADVMGTLADAAFGHQGDVVAHHLAAVRGLGVADAWIGAVAYTFQIYFDFSGYSDIAIGLGLMFGFRFPVNFDQPYRAISITDFWRRWHKTLSTWLRDYLYIPLGGNQRGSARTYVNLALTMLLGGLWHGANWTFLAWGAYQGFWLIVERLRGRSSLLSFAPRPLQMAVTFVVVIFGWVLFKAPDITTAAHYAAAMLGLGNPHATALLEVRPLHLIVFAVAALVTWGFPTTQQLVARTSIAWSLALQPAFIVAVIQLHYQDHVPFLYFQF